MLPLPPHLENGFICRYPLLHATRKQAQSKIAFQNVDLWLIVCLDVLVFINPEDLWNANYSYEISVKQWRSFPMYFTRTGLKQKFLTNLALQDCLGVDEEQKFNLGVSNSRGYRTLIYIEPESGVQLQILQRFSCCVLTYQLVLYGKFSRGNQSPNALWWILALCFRIFKVDLNGFGLQIIQADHKVDMWHLILLSKEIGMEIKSMKHSLLK